MTRKILEEKAKDTLDARAEALWEALGGDLCLCQRADVVHWCEGCQQRIGLIRAALRGQSGG